MAKASQQKDVKPAEKKIDLKNIAYDMKRNFSRYMTKLGAHITHLAIFSANRAVKISGKGLRLVKSKALPQTLNMVCAVAGVKDKVLNAVNNAQEYYYDLEDSLGETRVNEGFFPAVKLFCSSAAHKMWSFKGGIVTIFNWAAPVVSIIFLFNVVTYATNLNYGISVECNGEKLGLITEESEYDEAEMALQQRITYVEGNEKIVITPKLSVQMVRDAKEIVNPTQLVDKMIVSSDEELSNAYGLYIDGQFMGALTDRKPVIGQRTGKGDKTHWIIFMKEGNQ